LAEYAEVYVNHEEDTTDKIHFFPFDPCDPPSILNVMNAEFEMEFLPLLSYLDMPFVISIR